MEPQFLPETLEGDRIVLKPRSTDIAEEFFCLIDSNRDYLSQWMFWLDTAKTIEDVQKSCADVMDKWSKKTAFSYVIFEKNSNEIMGTVGTHDISWDSDSTTIGYWLAEKYNGKGYMTESVKLLEDTLFNAGLNRLVIETDLENKKSFNIPERLGYNLDGVMREDCIENGEYRSSKIYSKLRSEWKTS